MPANPLETLTSPIKLVEATPELVKAVQQLLGVAVDGIPGPKTLEAFRRFKAASFLSDPDWLGPTTAQKLLSSEFLRGKNSSANNSISVLVTKAWATAIFGRSPSLEQMADLNSCLARFEINTPTRMRHFLSQIAHESGGLKWMKELASGDAYEGRLDLGNKSRGDGRRYKGAGCLQVTGRSNYQALSNYLKDSRVMEGCDYVAVSLPFTASGHWWMRNQMNGLCDRNPTVEQVTLKVNGGLNGLSDRKMYYARACQVIKG